MNDNQIIEGIQSGKLQEIRKTTDYLYHQLLKKFFRKISNKFSGLNEEQISDAFAEAFTSLVLNIQKNKFKAESKISTYFFSILNRKCIAIHEKSKREKPLKEESELENMLQKMGIITPSSFDIWLEQQDKDELHKGLQNAMENLDEKCRKILIDFYYHELKMTEITAIYNFKNENTAKASKYNCLKKLKKIL